MPNPSPTSADGRCLPATALPERRAAGEQQLIALVHGARAGDPTAWTRLVQRFDRVLRRIARSYGLAPTEVDDVVQMTWLDLLGAIEQIREPKAIGGWLATATRRNALRRIQSHVRERLTDDPLLGDCPDANEPEASALTLERDGALAAAIARLPGRHRDLVTVLLTHPTLTYREIAELLCMPIGSIGPIRARALARLAHDARLGALREPPRGRSTDPDRATGR
jgi:RNA polymerase sigma factor (sigma-70 family)